MFQIKLFFYEKVCCRNRAAKMLINEKFREKCELYDLANEKITQKLSMTKLLKLNLKFKDEYIQNKMHKNLELIKKGILEHPLLQSLQFMKNEDNKSVDPELESLERGFTQKIDK